MNNFAEHVRSVMIDVPNLTITIVLKDFPTTWIAASAMRFEGGQFTFSFVYSDTDTKSKDGAIAFIHSRGGAGSGFSSYIRDLAVTAFPELKVASEGGK